MRILRRVMFLASVCWLLSSCASLLNYAVNRAFDSDAKFELLEEDEPKTKPKKTKRQKVNDKLNEAYPANVSEMKVNDGQ